MREWYPHLDTCSADDHIPDIERYIRMIKDRTRSTYQTLPFTHIPKIMLTHLVMNVVFWLNSFPVQDGISSTQSPRFIMTGHELDYKKHAQLLFGEYVQTHEEHDNSMHARTIGAICLGPTGSQQAAHWFMSLRTGAKLART